MLDRASLPIPILLFPVVRSFKLLTPIAQFPTPSVAFSIASSPSAQLEPPMVNTVQQCQPTAVFFPPSVIDDRAPSPTETHLSAVVNDE